MLTYEGRWFADEWDKALRARGQTKPSRERYRQLPDYAHSLGAYEWSLPPESHADFFVGDLATWWLESRPKPDRLFMQIGFLGPHPPYDPVPDYAERYLKDLRVPVPDAVPADLDGLPAFLKAKREHDSEVDHDAVLWSMTPTHQQLKRQRAYYPANVTMIDEAFGKLLAVLEKKGNLDESLIVFAATTWATTVSRRNGRCTTRSHACLAYSGRPAKSGPGGGIRPGGVI